MAIFFFTFTLCLHCIAMSWAGSLAWPWLWQTYYSLSPCVSIALSQASPGAWPGLGCGNLIVHFYHMFPLHCHKLGRALGLALAMAILLFTFTMCFHCIATSWAGRFAWPWMGQTYCSLAVCLCTVMLALP